MPFETVLRVAAELEIGVDVIPRWKGEALDRLLDEAHSRLVEALLRRYVAAGWEVAVEVSFSIDGERGSVDVCAFERSLGLISVNEVKSVVPDGQAAIHALDRKSRLAIRIAADRGWAASRVVRFLVIGDDRTARRRIEGHEPMFRAAFPLFGREALRWIDDPAGSLAAVGSALSTGQAVRSEAPSAGFLANGAFRAMDAPAGSSESSGVRAYVLVASGLFFLSPLPAGKAAERIDSRHRVRPRDPPNTERVLSDQRTAEPAELAPGATLSRRP